MRRRYADVVQVPRLLVVVAAFVIGIGSAGCSDGTSAVTPGGLTVRTIDITMKEMSFSPSKITVKVGETVTFHFTNKGTVRHEAVIGDEAAQEQAMATMRAMDSSSTTTAVAAGGPGRSRRAVARHDLKAHPGMGLPNVISLEAGQSGDITFTFARAGSLLIECHEVGHLEAGMKAALVVVTA